MELTYVRARCNSFAHHPGASFAALYPRVGTSGCAQQAEGIIVSVLPNSRRTSSIQWAYVRPVH